MIPKTHGAKLTDVPDRELAEILVRFGVRVLFLAFFLHFQKKGGGGVVSKGKGGDRG